MTDAASLVLIWLKTTPLWCYLTRVMVSRRVSLSVLHL